MNDSHRTVINLCDRPLDVVAAFAKTSHGRRFQIGSYSCANYFEAIVKRSDDLCCGNFDLVIPVLPEHKLDLIGQQPFRDLCDFSTMIVVNDFGLLDYFSKRDALRMGRMFFRDYRDKRYPAYDQEVYYGKAKSLIRFVSNMGIRVSAVESDIITKKLILDIPDGIERYFHFPYRQISSGHICEYAAIGRPIEEKYVPDDACSMQCQKMMIKSSAGYLKIAKNIYDLIDDSYLSVMTENDYLIITPGGDMC